MKLTNLPKTVLTIVAGFFLTFCIPVLAGSFDLSVTVPMNPSKVVVGDIISYVNNAYALSSSEYDNDMFGIVDDTASIYLTDLDLAENNKVVVSSKGEMLVRVSTANGSIKIGDYITSSSIAGVGQRADQSGMVLGVALENYESEDVNDVGLLTVLVDIKSNFRRDPLTKNLLGALFSGTSSPFLTPLASLRYVAALIIVATTFIIGFSSFGRLSGRSIEALGRNPLATASIKKVTVYNFFMTLIIILTGIAVAYLILVL